MDPGDSTLCHRRRPRPLPPLLPPSAAAAPAIGRYRCRLRPLLPPVTAAVTAAAGRCFRRPPLSATATAATAAIGRYWCCLRTLPPPVTVTAAVNFRLRRPPLLPSSAAPAVAAGRSRRRPPWSTRGPTATSVGGGVFEDQRNPGRACLNPRDTFLNRPQGQNGPHARGALGLVDPLLPGGASVRGGPGPRPGAGDDGRT